MPLIAPQPNPTPPATAAPSFTACPYASYASTPPSETWYQILLPTPVPNFDICSTCYNTSLRATPYARFVAPSAPRRQAVTARCEFAGIWIRVAFNWVFSLNLPDLSLLGAVHKLAGGKPGGDGACPNFDTKNEEVKKGDKKAEVRSWYSLLDPETGTLVEEITVCDDCVAHIYTIVPGLTNVFAPAAGGQKVLATCDLMMLGYGTTRCLSYLDQIMEAGENSLKTGTLSITPLLRYFRKWGPVPICQRESKTNGGKCYTIPSVGPDWTACEECYLTHIEPVLSTSLVLRDIASSMPATGFTCTMYTPRLRSYFQAYLSTADATSLRHNVRLRTQKLADSKRQLETLQLEHQNLKKQADWHIHASRIEQANAQISRSAATVAFATNSPMWDVSGLDTRAVNNHLNQGRQAVMQADIVMSKLSMLEKEWNEQWE